MKKQKRTTTSKLLAALGICLLAGVLATSYSMIVPSITATVYVADNDCDPDDGDPDDPPGNADTMSPEFAA